MGKGILIGLTGQTGAGKSLVCKLLGSLGHRVIDADQVARQVVDKGSQCILELALEFGIDILNPDGTLNRRKLGDIVFADPAKRRRLNRITFPYIQEEIFFLVDQMRLDGARAIFLDAPTLIESGTHKRCDKVVSVIAPRDVRLERIIERDRITREAALRRMSAQRDDEYYTSRSDHIIWNDGDLNQLRERVLEMLRALLLEEA